MLSRNSWLGVGVGLGSGLGSGMGLGLGLGVRVWLARHLGDAHAAQEPLVNLLRNGKGQMPKYQGAIPPVSRLTDDELEAVAVLVLDTAKASSW